MRPDGIAPVSGNAGNGRTNCGRTLQFAGRWCIIGHVSGHRTAHFRGMYGRGRKRTMKLMEDRICRDGIVAGGDILKVGSFLNQQIDVGFICEAAQEFYRLYGQERVTKILTVEASGIGLACLISNQT